MKLVPTALPGYKVFEYVLVLQPHEELWSKIVKIKNEFAQKYQTNYAKWGKPHIALVNFVQYQLMEDRIINNLNTIAMGYQPVKIELKDYGSFPSHTIYINVTSKLPIQQLIKTIRTNTQRLMKLNDDNKPHFMAEQYVTIARKLLPWQYEQGWLEYSHKYFTGKFIADGMLLLKRQVGQLKYEIAQRFPFQNLPVSTKQAELFG